MEIIIAVLSCTTLACFILAVYYEHMLEKTKKQWEEKWANRTVGSVVSSEVTSEGLEVDLEITDQETWNKLKQGTIGGASLWSNSVEPTPTHHPIYKGPGTQAWAEEQWKRNRR